MRGAARRNRFSRFGPAIWNRWLARGDEAGDEQTLRLRAGIRDMQRALQATELRLRGLSSQTRVSQEITISLPAVRRVMLDAIAAEFDRLESDGDKSIRSTDDG